MRPLREEGAAFSIHGKRKSCKPAQIVVAGGACDGLFVLAYYYKRTTQMNTINRKPLSELQRANQATLSVNPPPY